MEYNSVNVNLGKKGESNIIAYMLEEVWHTGKFRNRSEAVRWCIATGFRQLGCKLPEGVVWGEELAEPQS